MAGLKFLFTIHEIHKHRAARGVLRDGDEPRGAADERAGAAKQHKTRDPRSHCSEFRAVVSN